MLLLCSALAAILAAPPAAPPSAPLPKARWLEVPADEQSRPLLEREATGLTVQNYTSPDGRYTGRVHAEAIPRVEAPAGGAVQVHIAIGKGAEIVCSLLPEPASVAQHVQRFLERAAAQAELRAGTVAGVWAIDGKPALVVDSLFEPRGGGGVSELKVGLAVGIELSVQCAHEGAGYRQTFLRTLREFVESARDTQARPTLPSSWAEVHALSHRGRLVGFRSTRSTPRLDGQGRIEVELESLLVFGAGGPRAVESSRIELVGEGGGLVKGDYGTAEAGHDTSLVRLSWKSGNDYEVSGKRGILPLSATLHAQSFLRQPAAAEVLAVAQGRAEEVSLQSFNPGSPERLRALALRREGKGPEVQALLDGKLVMRGQVDALGAFEKTVVSPGTPDEVQSERLWSSGTPP
jgi:hypothetical protein